MKKVIIALLAVLVIVAIGLQVREIVNAYQVAYKEELVPDKKAVETNTKQRPLYEIGRAEGEKTGFKSCTLLIRQSMGSSVTSSSSIGSMV
ncbi:hypothetical protein OVA29_01905 [Exiguobacterium sp. SL14]|nr:hypothetical protein [Exiguobacterium sp. SL14]MCY1689733.1 hypothetical protein [Exiguobacterium sp. SL14]